MGQKRAQIRNLGTFGKENLGSAKSSRRVTCTVVLAQESRQIQGMAFSEDALDTRFGIKFSDRESGFSIC